MRQALNADTHALKQHRLSLNRSLICSSFLLVIASDVHLSLRAKRLRNVDFHTAEDVFKQTTPQKTKKTKNKTNKKTNKQTNKQTKQNKNKKKLSSSLPVTPAGVRDINKALLPLSVTGHPWTMHQLWFMFFISASRVLRQVVFGRPRFRFPLGSSRLQFW